MKARIFQTINAGLYLWREGCGLLVDGLHWGREAGMSELPGPIAEQLRTGRGLFAHMTGLLFTHLHTDHYDEGYVRMALQDHPELPLYGPKLPGANVTAQEVRPGVRRFSMGPAEVAAVETAHDGAIFRDMPHMSYLIRMDGESLFIAGDAALEPEAGDLVRELYDTPVEGAFLNLYQIVSPKGQEFLRRLAPRRLFLYHLPFPGDDRYQIILQSRQRLKRMPEGLPPVEFPAALSWVDGSSPEWAEHA